MKSLSADLAKFRAWFLEFDARVWDAQIESDLKAGKLQGLIAEGHWPSIKPARCVTFEAPCFFPVLGAIPRAAHGRPPDRRQELHPIEIRSSASFPSFQTHRRALVSAGRVITLGHLAPMWRMGCAGSGSAPMLSTTSSFNTANPPKASGGSA